jgi:hypothetical protein
MEGLSFPRASLSAGFPATFKRKFPKTGLAGWRRSADGHLLCPFSLLTGNFTGISPGKTEIIAG